MSSIWQKKGGREKNEKIFYPSEGSPGKYIVILMLDRLGQDLSFAMFLYLILIL